MQLVEGINRSLEEVESGVGVSHLIFALSHNLELDSGQRLEKY